MTNTISGTKDDKVCPLCQSPYMPPSGKPIYSAEDALPHLEHFRNKKQEYFICLSLDSSKRIITLRIVTIGLLDIALVHPREVFAGPLSDRAASVIVAHNHPSGDPRSSSADLEATRQLAAAGILLGVPLESHVIIASNGHVNF